jgi:hypothetical protein
MSSRCALWPCSVAVLTQLDTPFVFLRTNVEVLTVLEHRVRLSSRTVSLCSNLHICTKCFIKALGVPSDISSKHNISLASRHFRAGQFRCQSWRDLDPPSACASDSLRSSSDQLVLVCQTVVPRSSVATAISIQRSGSLLGPETLVTNVSFEIARFIKPCIARQVVHTSNFCDTSRHTEYRLSVAV